MRSSLAKAQCTASTSSLLLASERINLIPIFSTRIGSYFGRDPNQNIIPIEVKSGHGASMQSMRVFQNTHPASPYDIRFSIHQYSVFDKIRSYPLYAVAAIIENKENMLKLLSYS